MLKYLYSFAVIFLALAWLPRLFKGKYKSSLKERLGFVVPQIDNSKPGPLIWIHAVSVGETKAAAALVEELRRQHPESRFVISSITETGQMEAERSIPDAEAYFFLPLDFSWMVRRTIQALQPTTLLLVEGEFWYNLLNEAKRYGCKIALVNGKLSIRSARRFSKVPCFSKALFGLFDMCCLQTEEYRQAFLQLGVPPENIAVTGNLKFDSKPIALSEIEKENWKNQLGIQEQDFIVVLGSTHEGEEKTLLSSIQPLFDSIPSLKILLVPRHPHRFDRVAEILSEQGLVFHRFSTHCSAHAKVVLVDTMGKLMTCYQIAHIGVVAGSFVPGIGGHNLFEPAACRIPVLFGPYVDTQQAYADALVASQGGISIEADKIREIILDLYQNRSRRETMGVAALGLVEQSMGAAKKTLELLESKSIT
ncbi:MAG: 3-deoxy-D-manno-octulosonic acid transferase [Simkania sp.]|nr:3-deoxy-D-manno-octulosonic acid transferase [Simkania sp.]